MAGVYFILRLDAARCHLDHIFDICVHNQTVKKENVFVLISVVCPMSGSSTRAIDDNYNHYKYYRSF